MTIADRRPLGHRSPMPSRLVPLLSATLLVALTAGAASAQYVDVPRDRKGRPWPAHLRYEEGAPVPNGYHVDTHPRTAFIIAGAVTFGTFYGLSAWGAAASRESSAKALYIPIAGPIIYGASFKGMFAGLGMFVMLIDAIAQAGGTTMFIIGLQEKTELTRNDLARVHVMPIVTNNQAGLGLFGVF